MSARPGKMITLESTTNSFALLCKWLVALICKSGPPKPGLFKAVGHLYQRHKSCQFSFQFLQRIPPKFQIWNGTLLTFGEFIIGAAVQFPAGFGFADTAPLFEKEGDPCILALQADIAHPFSIHWPRARPAFATHNYPIDAPQVDGPKMFQQWFNGKKANLCGRGAEQIHARQTVLAVFHAHAPPDMRLLRREAELAFQ